LEGVICHTYYHKCGTGNTGAAIYLTTSNANSISWLRMTPEILVGFFGADFFLGFFILTTLARPPYFISTVTTLCIPSLLGQEYAHMNRLYAVVGE
jgi:hypothetical protein